MKYSYQSHKQLGCLCGFDFIGEVSGSCSSFVDPMGILSRSTASKNPNGSIMRPIIPSFVGVVFGFLMGVSFHTLSSSKLYISSGLLPSINITCVEEISSNSTVLVNESAILLKTNSSSNQNQNMNTSSEIWVPTNPRGAERLPPRIVAAESDFYLRRLWGNPKEDITIQQKYLVTFTVGYDQRANIDKAVKKFSEKFTILLFHYDGRTTEWDEFEWSKKAIHISVHKQTKWWYAKRFLHPDIVAPYDYIFIWDEDLGVENFDAEKYIEIAKKHGLEISQPGLEPRKGSTITWAMSKKQANHDVHKSVVDDSRCSNNTFLPPCAAFVEIMAPVFAKNVWRCVWHLIQNDLVHGWGLDFAFRRCVEPAHEKIGVVDGQWIVHQSLPSLGKQGEAQDGKAGWRGVRERCDSERTMLRNRIANAEKSYFKSKTITL